jgi:hypothetical protein
MITRRYDGICNLLREYANGRAFVRWERWGFDAVRQRASVKGGALAPGPGRLEPLDLTSAPPAEP